MKFAYGIDKACGDTAPGETADMAVLSNALQPMDRTNDCRPRPKA